MQIFDRFKEKIEFHPKKKKRKKLHFFYSYLLVLIIPLIIGSIVYYKAYSIIETKEIEIRSLLIQECMQAMDNAIYEIDTTLMTLSSDSVMTKALSLDAQPRDGSPNAAVLYALNKKLSGVSSTLGAENRLIVSLNNADIVYDGSSIIYGTDSFFNYSLSYDDYTGESFQKKMLDVHHFRDVVGGVAVTKKRGISNPKLYQTDNAILYINSLPIIGSKNRIQGTAIVHIGDSIPNILSSIPISSSGCAYITDANNKMISGTFGEEYTDNGELALLEFNDNSGNFYQTINGTRMLISYNKSSYNGWNYVSMSGMNETMGGLTTLQSFIIFTTLMILLIGIATIILLSRRNSKPLELALIEIKKSSNLSESFDGTLKNLSKGINNIINDNDELNKTLKKHDTMIKSSFFERLFRGEFSSDEEIIAMSSYLNFDLSGKMYATLILSFEEYTDQFDAKSLFDNNILQIFSKKVSLGNTEFKAFTHTISVNRIAVLLCFDSNNADDNFDIVEKTILQLIEDIKLKLASDIHCSIGNFHEKLSDVCLSFSEASAALSYINNDTANQSFFTYKKVYEEKMGYFYPNEIEINLKNQVQSGNIDGVQESLNYIYNENFCQRKLSDYMIYSLLIDMYTTIIKICQDVEFEFNYGPLLKLRPIGLDYSEEFEHIRDAYKTVYAFAAATKSTSSKLITQIEQFVYENYHLSEMSVSMLATEFKFSESYFSQYFKNNTGQIFSKYLETLRINNACKLINETALNIDEIALAVGYNNTLSFRRAFKKIMGVTPSQLR